MDKMCLLVYTVSSIVNVMYVTMLQS